MLAIPSPLIAQMQDHARACYPDECCGLIFGITAADGLRATRCVPLENIANRLHGMDPVEYPRTARDAFSVNEAKMGRLVREAEAAGERWLAFFHSHIDCGAYFSAEDRKYAAPEGVPVYPELLQIVIDCRTDRIIEAKGFRWDGADFALVQSFPEFARSGR